MCNEVAPDPKVLAILEAHGVQVLPSDLPEQLVRHLLELEGASTGESGPEWETVIAPDHQLPREAKAIRYRIEQATGSELQLRRMMLMYLGRCRARILYAPLAGRRYYVMAKFDLRPVVLVQPPELRPEPPPGRHRRPDASQPDLPADLL